MKKKKKWIKGQAAVESMLSLLLLFLILWWSVWLTTTICMGGEFFGYEIRGMGNYYADYMARRTIVTQIE